jgi:hypothetical protein
VALVSYYGLFNAVKTWEIRLHTVLSIFSLFAYPTLQLTFTFVLNGTYSTIAPQFVSHLENFTIGILCIMMNKRLAKLKTNTINRSSASRLSYYIALNYLLAICVFLDGGFLGVINLDSVIPSKYIATHKFLLDFFTRLFNFGFVHTYPIAILLLYPSGISISENKGGTQYDKNKGSNNALNKSGLVGSNAGLLFKGTSQFDKKSVPTTNSYTNQQSSAHSSVDIRDIPELQKSEGRIE